MAIENKIPRATAMRLSQYYRSFQILRERGVHRISSAELADMLKLDSATIRRDFSFFGELGKRGYGYDVDKLEEFFTEILQTDDVIKVALIGVGNLGRALLNFQFPDKSAVKIVSAFDIDELAEEKKAVNDIKVYPISKLASQIQKDGVETIILAVPSEEAQKVTTNAVEAGIKGVLNFTPTNPTVPAGVRVQNIDLTSELQSLNYFVKNYTNILSAERRGR